MSHELEIINGEAQMAYAGDTPWHGLGTKVPADVSPDQMMEAAGLNWEVRKQPMFINDGLGTDTKVPGKQALVRSSDNKILDIVGDTWNPVQNSEAFNFFSDFVGAGDMEMHTAGSLKDGQIVWALAKVNESFEAVPGDRVDSYLLFTNPHRFGQSINVTFTPTRVVCNNTLTMALNGAANAVKVNHSKQFNADEVKEMLGIASFKLEQYKEMSQFLAHKKYTQDNVREYFNSLFPTYSKKDDVADSRQTNRLMELLGQQAGANFAEGSWWSAFNAVTYYTDHERGRDSDTRLQSAWYGQSRQLKIKALGDAVKYAEAA